LLAGRQVIARLERLFAYDAWANRDVLGSLKSALAPPASPPHASERDAAGVARALRIMAHVLAAEDLWLSRLRQDGQAIVVWPELDLEGAFARTTDLEARWRLFLGALEPHRLSQALPYVNSKGERWESTVEDILLHVVLHSSYHRGQVALVLRGSGWEPAYTDYIHCVRQGFLIAPTPGAS